MDVLPIREFSVHYTLGETLFSGEHLIVTIFKTFLSKGRYKSKIINWLFCS